jgi:hypothetical protein
MEKEIKKSDLIEKLDRGLKLTYERLLASKKASGGTLVFMKDGKIVKVKASDL